MKHPYICIVSTRSLILDAVLYGHIEYETTYFLESLASELLRERYVKELRDDGASRLKDSIVCKMFLGSDRAREKAPIK